MLRKMEDELGSRNSLALCINKCRGRIEEDTESKQTQNNVMALKTQEAVQNTGGEKEKAWRNDETNWSHAVFKVTVGHLTKD